MLGLIDYKTIEKMQLQTALNQMIIAPKIRFGLMKMEDLAVNGDINSQLFYNLNRDELYGKGVYVFFDEGKPIYVGKAKRHFLHRFQSHLSYDPRPGWAWNELLKKTAEKKLIGYDGNFSEEIYSKAIDIAFGYEVIRINTLNQLPEEKITRLERFVMNGFNTLYPDTLLNGSLKNISLWMQKPLNVLMQ